MPGLTDDQRDSLRTALIDALADLSGCYTAEPADDLEDDDDAPDNTIENAEI